MATASLAPQWSPPPSSPLFDEQQHQHQQQGSHPRSSPGITVLSSPSPQQQRPSPSASRSPAPAHPPIGSTGGGGGAGVSGGSSSSASYFSTLPSSATTRNLAPLPLPSLNPRTPSPQPRSYAAAASSPLPLQRASPQIAQVPSHQQQQQQKQQYSPQPHYSPLHQNHSGSQQYLPQHHHQQQQNPKPMWNPQSYQMQPQAQAFVGLPQSQQRPQNPFGPPQGQPHLGHNTSGFHPAYNMPFAPPAMPNQYAWAQYQQMLAAQTQQFHHQAQMHHQPPAADASFDSSAVARDRRISSSSQRPSLAIGYNDSFQSGNPGASYASAAGNAVTGGRGSLPPGAMAPHSSTSPFPQGSPSFHPYRRQHTTQGATSVTSSPGQQAQQQLQPPLSERKRTPSAKSIESSPSRPEQSAPVSATANISQMPPPPSRTESTRSSSSGVGTATNGSEKSLPHSRHDSISSQNSSISSSAAVSDNASTLGGRSTPTPPFKRSSPLSRQPVPQEDDDNDTNADYGGSDREDGVLNGRATPTPANEKKKGLSGKIRKALSLTTVNEMQQQQSNNASVKSRPSGAPIGRTIPHFNSNGRTVGSAPTSGGPPRPSSPSRSEFGGGHFNDSSATSISSRRGGRPPVSNSAGATAADGNGKRSLFNRKFNSSTDNISISSTVSSASVMLRKVGNLGKMARRHSLMGLTNMFNKDKEGRDSGRGGLQTDDFGTLTPSASSAGISAPAKNSGSDDKNASGTHHGKSVPAAASVSHATVELDPNVGDGSMTPAAHYVRQHQIQMRQQAEAEERTARERQEAEAAAAKNKSASGAMQGKTTDDIVESRQKMIEKEKERLKSKRTWRNRLRVGGGSSVDVKTTAAPTGLETIPYTEGSDPAADLTAAPQDVYSASTSAPTMTSHFPQDSISGGVGAEGAYLDDQELVPPHMPAAGGGAGGEESGDECETDSLRHWGEGIERSRASAALVKAPRGILKKSVSSSQLDQFVSTGGVPGIGDGAVAGAFQRPFSRVRASSYDAPQAPPAPGAPMLSALSTTTEGVDRMDGVARPPSPARDGQCRPASSGDGSHPSGPSSLPSAAPNVPAFGHHSNASMPTLTMMTNPTTGALPSPSHRPSMQRKRICFTEEHIYHSTWPAHVYDRRGESATCNRLTPLLAQRIKEELNSFKMEEMEVAPSSRIYTHFFI